LNLLSNVTDTAVVLVLSTNTSTYTITEKLLPFTSKLNSKANATLSLILIKVVK